MQVRIVFLMLLLFKLASVRAQIDFLEIKPGSPVPNFRFNETKVSEIKAIFGKPDSIFTPGIIECGAKRAYFFWRELKYEEIGLVFYFKVKSAKFNRIKTTELIKIGYTNKSNSLLDGKLWVGELDSNTIIKKFGKPKISFLSYAESLELAYHDLGIAFHIEGQMKQKEYYWADDIHEILSQKNFIITSINTFEPAEKK